MKVKLLDCLRFAMIKNSDAWQEFAKVPIDVKASYQLALLSYELNPHLQAFEEARAKAQSVDELNKLMEEEIEVSIKPFQLKDLPKSVSVAVIEALLPFISNKEGKEDAV